MERREPRPTDRCLACELRVSRPGADEHPHQAAPLAMGVAVRTSSRRQAEPDEHPSHEEADPRHIICWCGCNGLLDVVGGARPAGLSSVFRRALREDLARWLPCDELARPTPLASTQALPGCRADAVCHRRHHLPLDSCAAVWLASRIARRQQARSVANVESRCWRPDVAGGGRGRGESQA